MSDFDQDVSAAISTYKKWVNDNGIRGDDGGIIDSALETYSKLRSETFASLVEKFDNYDEWKSLAQKGSDGIAALNSAVPSTTAEGLKGLGLDSFYQGELNAWKECQSAVVPLVSSAIKTIEEDDKRMTEQLQNDLKTAMSDAATANESFRVSQSGNFKLLGNFAARLAEKGLEKLAKDILHIPEDIRKPMGDFMDKMRESLPQMSELAKRRKAFREVLLNNDKRLEDAKAKMNDGNITNSMETAIKWTGSLKGSYSSDDWSTFAKRCEDKLRAQAAPAVSQAKNLFETVRRDNMEGLAKAFATMLGTPDELKTYKGQINEYGNKIFEGFNSDQRALDSLRGGTILDSAKSDLREIKELVAAQLKTWYDQLDQAERNN